MRSVINVKRIKMIEKILVTPRKLGLYVSKKRATSKLAIISICSYKRDIIFTKAVRKRMGCENILSLVFADLTETDFKIAPELIKKFPTFNVKMAQQIIQFLNKLKEKDIKLLIIHCDAGVSRSGAVGIFACRYLGMDEKEFRKEHRFIGPNTLIYDLLIKESGMRDDYQKWWDDYGKEIDPRIIFT